MRDIVDGEDPVAVGGGARALLRLDGDPAAERGRGAGLPGSGLFERPVVVWLNELQGFLAPNGQGLSVDVLDDLYAAATRPAVLVGTLWPDKLHTATDDRDDTRSDTRELLAEATPWVHWHDVPRSLTTPAERAAAPELAASLLGVVASSRPSGADPGAVEPGQVTGVGPAAVSDRDDDRACDQRAVDLDGLAGLTRPGVPSCHTRVVHFRPTSRAGEGEPSS